MTDSNNANTTDLVVPEQDVTTAKALDALPGLIGAIDRALIDQTGQKLPFVLIVFGAGGAMHATNISPASDAVKAVKQLAAAWADGDPEPVSGDANGG